MSSSTNINITGEGSLTSIVITVVVALIVTGAVLVPIIGGMTGNGGNGGGGGGGNGSDGILVNDVSELFSDMGVHIPDKYDSWVLYSHYEEMAEGLGEDVLRLKPSGNLDMPLDDLTELYEMNVDVDDYTHYVGFNSILCLNEDFEECFGMGVWWYISDDTHEEVIDRYIGVGEYEISDLSMISEFHLTYDMEEGIGNLNMVFDVGDGDVEINETIFEAWVLSQEENGFISSEVVSYGINANDSMPLSVNITEGVYAVVGVRAQSIQWLSAEKIGIVGINNGVLSDNEWFLDDMHLDHDGQFEMTADVTITLTDGKIPIFYNPNVSFDEVRNVDDWTVSGGDTSIYYLSTMAFSASDDSGDGGSSDNGSDLGTVGTIIGVIPIFVVLAILMYAVSTLRMKYGSDN